MLRTSTLVLAMIAGGAASACLSLLVPVGGDLTNGATGPSTAPEGGAREAGGGPASPGDPRDGGATGTGDDDAASKQGCEPPTGTGKRLLCEEFAGGSIAAEWINGVTAHGQLTLVNEPSVSKPHALRSSVDGTAAGDDARLFQNFAGAYKRARLTFDLQIEASSGYVAALAIADCAFLVGLKGDGAVGVARNGRSGEDVPNTYDDPALAEPKVWRRITLEASDKSADVLIDGTRRMTLSSSTSCGIGLVAVTIGIYAQVEPGAVYIDNVSLDVD